MSKEQNELHNAFAAVIIGLFLSLSLSLVGTIQSHHFSAVALVVSFMCSAILSIIIGVLVPFKKINDSCVKKLKLKNDGIPARIVISIVDDLIFTPIISLLMIFMAYKRATKFGTDGVPTFGMMYLRAAILCIIVGFFVILFTSPIADRIIKAIIENANEEE